MKTKTLLLAILMSFSTAAIAQIINVPSYMPTIQAGIDAANDGDMVLVDTGIYYENINFKGKAITVASKYIMNHDENYRDNTIINGSNPSNHDSASVVTFASGENNTSIIYGFTITEGSGTATNWSGLEGGGIFVNDAWPKISNNLIMGNIVFNGDNLITSTLGAGISAKYSYGIPEGKTIIIENNIIRDNVLIADNYSAYGGGISIRSTASNDDTQWVIIKDNVIKNNIAVSNDAVAYGGGILTLNIQTWIINNVISNNTAEAYNYANGGGICFLDDNSYHTHHLILDHNNIESNFAIGGFESYGGGIFTRGGVIFLEYNNIENNIISDQGNYKRGAGLCIDLLEAPGIIQYNDFINNSNLTCEGGAICAFSVELQILHIEGNLFMGNSASHGGAINTKNCDISFYNNVFTKNFAYQGGALSIFGSEINLKDHPYRIINNTFYDNHAVYNGGAIYTSYNDPIILNNIFVGDTAISGSEIFAPPGGNAEIAWCNIDPDLIEGYFTLGEGMINVDPMFCDSLGYVCMINCASLCINAGTPTYTSSSGSVFLCPEYDILLNPRPLSGGVDLGAFELLLVTVEEEVEDNNLISTKVFPNPISTKANIVYEILEETMVELSIYNSHGQAVEILIATYQQPGTYQATWNAEGLPSGVYFYRLTAGQRVVSGKVIIQ